MIIRKLFKFENAHIVRGCSTKKCRSSIHGHSYKVEVKFHSNFLDNGQMVYDFGLIKQNIKELIDIFDHSISLWAQDKEDYKEGMKKFSSRWIELPVSPSAEQLSRIIFVMIDSLMKQTKKRNGEKEVSLYSIVIHETDTGYAECFQEDAYNCNMGLISLKDIKISDAIVKDFKNKNLWQELLDGVIFVNPTDV